MDTGENGTRKQYEGVQRDRRRATKVFHDCLVGFICCTVTVCVCVFFKGLVLVLNLEEKQRRKQDVKSWVLLQGSTNLKISRGF